MPESESFDAFYARTVRSVTNQMHELSGGDSTADHAVREAYAHAYQQWYQVSGYSDTEGWVLGTAKDAYQRRQAAAAASGQSAGSTAARNASGDVGTWPGIYRPVAKPAQQAPAGSYAAGQPADPEATVAPPQRGRGAGRGTRAAGFLSGAFGARGAGARKGAGSSAPAGPASAEASRASGSAPRGPAGGADWFDAGSSMNRGAAGPAAQAADVPEAGGGYGGPLPDPYNPAVDRPASQAADWAPGGYGGPPDKPYSPVGDRPSADAADWTGAVTSGAAFGGPAWAVAPGRNATARIDDYPGAAAQSGWTGFEGSPDGPAGPGSAGRGGRGFSLPASRRTMVAAIAIAALVIAGITYFAIGGNQPGRAANPGTAANPGAKSGPQMLAAGQTGRRSAVPWSLVRAGWALTELSTAPPGASGNAASGGTYTTYLVDPEGGKYQITSSAGSSEPELLAWSGDAKTALLGSATSLSSPQQASYSLLNVVSGQVTSLSLPPDVVPVGLSRPDGLAILAVSEAHPKFQLQRYALSGGLQRTIARLARPQNEVLPAAGCSSAACALSSPNGDLDVWGIAGDEMEVVSNLGGHPRKLKVPGSGGPPSCVPLKWWNKSTVLANCAAPGSSADTQRLWLVPASGGTPTPVTSPSGQPSGDGVVTGAWRAGGKVYVTSTSSRQCPGAPGGADGLGIQPASQAGSATIVSVPGSTNNVTTIVAVAGARLLVLTQTSCPGTSSLLWFNPGTGASTTVLTAPSSQVGVVTAVPFGNGPTAVTSGTSQ